MAMRFKILEVHCWAHLIFVRSYSTSTCSDVDDIESLSHEFLIIVAKEMSEEYFFKYAPARMMARGRKPAALQIARARDLLLGCLRDTVAGNELIGRI